MGTLFTYIQCFDEGNFIKSLQCMLETTRNFTTFYEVVLKKIYIVFSLTNFERCTFFFFSTSFVGALLIQSLDCPRWWQFFRVSSWNQRHYHSLCHICNYSSQVIRSWRQRDFWSTQPKLLQLSNCWVQKWKKGYF